MKNKYYVQGMTCAACVSHVEEAVKSINGIETVHVNLLTTEIVVTGEVDESAIFEKVYKAGYKVTKEKPEKKQSSFKKLIIPIILSIVLMYVSMGEMMSLPIFDFLKDKLINGIVQFVLATIVIIMIILLVLFREEVFRICRLYMTEVL